MLFILTKLTLSVCVWWWSCNLLHGSRWWCRWVCGCVESEWGPAMGVLLVLFMDYFWNGFDKQFMSVIIERRGF